MIKEALRMNQVNFLPLGSIVLLDAGTQKLLIVARGLNVQHNGQKIFFDYGAVPYPQGLSGDQLAYFNHDSVRSIYFIGCNDGDNQVIVDALNAYLAQHENIVRISADEWNRENN